MFIIKDLENTDIPQRRGKENLLLLHPDIITLVSLGLISICIHLCIHVSVALCINPYLYSYSIFIAVSISKEAYSLYCYNWPFYL